MSSSYKRYFNHGAFSLLNRGSIVLIGFFNVLLMVRIIPQEQIGVWVLYTSATAILEMIRAGFIRNPLITHLVSAPETDRKSILTASLTLHIGLALITSIIIALSAVPLAGFWKSPDLIHLFFLYALQNLMLIPFFHIEYLQTAKMKFNAIFICNIIRQGIPCLFIFLQLIMSNGTSLTEIALVQIIAVCVAIVTGYFFVKDLIHIEFKFHKKLCTELFHFGKYTFGTNVSSMFLRSTDSWMLGRLASTTAVAIYNPALKLANIFEVPTLAITNFIFPQVAQRMRDHGTEGVRDIYIKSVSLMLALTIPMVLPLYLFSEFFITLIFGYDYREAGDILKVTIFYSLIIPFNRQFGTTMDALKRPKLNFYTLFFMALLNVVLNYFFLQAFGIIGCAYATLISFGIVFIFNQIILYRQFKINFLHVIENIFIWYAVGWNLITVRFQKALN